MFVAVEDTYSFEDKLTINIERSVHDYVSLNVLTETEMNESTVHDSVSLNVATGTAVNSQLILVRYFRTSTAVIEEYFGSL